jgi:hypothetical protein
MQMTKEYLSNLNYDSLRLHPFFDSIVPTEPQAVENRNLFLSSIHLQSTCTVAKLSEYCIRAVGRACCVVAEQIAKNGGVKPHIAWIKVLTLLL